MTQAPPAKPTTTRTPHPQSEEELLDEAVEQTFPASDPVEIGKPEKLPPEHPPGSDVRED
jgi:hypothetical protein